MPAGNIVSLAFYPIHLDGRGLVGQTLRLELLEQGQGFFELAREALAVEAEGGESLGVGVEDVGDAQGFAHLVGGFVMPQILMDDADGEQIGFDRGDAVESPGGVGEGLDEVSFGGAFGLVFGREGAEVSFVGFVILGGHDDDLAGEAVTESVEGGASFALGCSGAGGEQRVTAIDFGAI